MAKAVFRPGEITLVGDRMVLDPPHSFPGLSHLAPVEELAEEAEVIEEYTGPTADDLRREAEAFKVQWETEKETIINSARVEADSIIREAERAASLEEKRTTDQAETVKREAGDEAGKIIAEAREKAARMEADSRTAFEAARKEAEEQGRASGHEAGFAEGRAEADRLVERTRVILERAQDKRGEILTETERQIVELVILVSRKVIKVISENQRDVVIANVTESLKKVKDRGNIVIRVNLADLNLATEHTRDFIACVEGAKSLEIIEDSTVDSGGCVIETDFGEIDARIASQLAEIEAKIREITPGTAGPEPLRRESE